MLRQFISAEPQLEFRRQSVFQNQFLQLAKSYPDPIIIRTPRRFRQDKVTVHFLKYDVFMKTIIDYRNTSVSFGLDFDAATDYMDKKDLDADIENVAGLFADFDDVSFNEKARYLYLDMHFKAEQDRQMLLGAFKMLLIRNEPPEH